MSGKEARGSASAVFRLLARLRAAGLAQDCTVNLSSLEQVSSYMQPQPNNTIVDADDFSYHGLILSSEAYAVSRATCLDFRPVSYRPADKYSTKNAKCSSETKINLITLHTPKSKASIRERFDILKEVSIDSSLCQADKPDNLTGLKNNKSFTRNMLVLKL